MFMYNIEIIFVTMSGLFCVNQMDQVKQDLSRKDTQLLGLQTKLETLTNQFSDSKQHIEVLKESLTAKEQRAAILQTEVGTQVVYQPNKLFLSFILECLQLHNLSGGCTEVASRGEGNAAEQKEQADPRHVRGEEHAQWRDP